MCCLLIPFLTDKSQLHFMHLKCNFKVFQRKAFSFFLCFFHSFHFNVKYPNLFQHYNETICLQSLQTCRQQSYPYLGIRPTEDSRIPKKTCIGLCCLGNIRSVLLTFTIFIFRKSTGHYLSASFGQFI